MRDVVGSPRFSPEIKSMPLMFGQLYYKETGTNGPGAGKMPVVIYLHEYSYSKGYAKKGSLINGFLDAGYAVLVFDQIGFGTRIEEGRLFYERFPNWSKMGRMVADVRWSVDALAELEFIDTQRIYATGYALGGTVGLYSAALDERIAGVIAVSGFTPMRSNTPGKTPEGIYEYSHLHGLLPRLGFFVKMKPVSHTISMRSWPLLHPGPCLLLRPHGISMLHYPTSVTVDQVEKVYDLFQSGNNVELYVPEDYNRLSDEMVGQMILWMQKNLNQ
jgi:pimeloyl-ACP methyl ester carboxylesterase